MIEIIIAGLLLFFVLSYTGKISGNQFLKDNNKFFSVVKELDYEFLVRSKYGDTVDVEKLFEKRIKLSIITILIATVFLSVNFTFVNLIVAVLLVFFVYKSSYMNLKSYYRRHLHDIDLLLPYYLKSLDILIQHYTVPVAIGKSINSAPPIFKDGLRELIAAINAGNATIDPYMDFAKKYPVRDSMRMMRLLYRLGLGSQERKQAQLLVFSRTISNLQAKARETKYKERLERMEKKTMAMLTVAGFGIMIILVFAIIQMFQI